MTTRSSLYDIPAYLIVDVDLDESPFTVWVQRAKHLDAFPPGQAIWDVVYIA